jgi:hypothetical protein
MAQKLTSCLMGRTLKVVAARGGQQMTPDWADDLETGRRRLCPAFLFGIEG